MYYASKIHFFCLIFNIKPRIHLKYGSTRTLAFKKCNFSHLNDYNRYI